MRECVKKRSCMNKRKDICLYGVEDNVRITTKDWTKKRESKGFLFVVGKCVW